MLFLSWAKAMCDLILAVDINCYLNEWMWKINWNGLHSSHWPKVIKSHVSSTTESPFFAYVFLFLSFSIEFSGSLNGLRAWSWILYLLSFKGQVLFIALLDFRDIRQRHSLFLLFAVQSHSLKAIYSHRLEFEAIQRGQSRSHSIT